MALSEKDIEALVDAALQADDAKNKKKMKTSAGMLSKINLDSFKQKDPDSSFFILMQDIDENCKEVIQWILEANFAENKPQVLNLIINSQGGLLSAAFAVIDTIRGSHIPVRTIGLGEICSAGLMIFMSGTKGMRVLTPNTSIMSHRFSGGSFGKEHELMAIGKEFNLTAKRIMNHYKKCTGQPEAVIIEKLLPPQDIYLDAKEAQALGVCDVISELK